MKMRISLFILTSAFLFILALLLLFGLLTQQGAMSTANVLPTPTVTSVPALPERIATGVNAVEQNVINPVLVLLELATALIIVVPSLLLFWLIIKLTRSFSLIIDTFQNSTGDDNLNKALIGLSQLARERLVLELKEYRTYILNQQNKNRSQDQNIYHFDKIPIPEGTQIPEGLVDQRLPNLLKSLQDVPSGTMKTALQFLYLVFLPRGTKITAVLQGRGNKPIRLGISLEVTDLRGEQEPALYTIWEPLAAPEGADDQLVTGVEEGQEIATDALALYTLGKSYEEREALDQAKRQYEDALQKQPSYEKAKAALKRVLQKKLTYEERYIDLLRPVGRWLAIELIRRSVGAHQMSIRSKSKHAHEQAKLYNFIGLLYQSSGQVYDKFFYRWAINAFQKAVETEKDWFAPYENLADTYSIMAAEDSSHQRQAVRYYDEALSRLDKDIPELSNDTSNDRDSIKHRIHVGKATAQLLIGDPKDTAKAKEEIEQVKQEWDISSEKNHRLLYNLACFYGLADKYHIDIPDAKQIGRRYLVYSLVRDRYHDQWDWAPKDPDLESITGGLKSGLFPLLEQKLQGAPDLVDADGRNFEDQINTILCEANWLS